MKNRKKDLMVMLLSLLLYLLALYCFVLLFIKSGRLDTQMNELARLKDLIAVPIEQLLIGVSILFSLFATLVEYGISKFLVTIFFEEKGIKSSDVFLAKTCSLLVNSLLLILFPGISGRLIAYSSLISVLVMFLLSFDRDKNLKLSFLFIAPFLIDTLLSIFRR